MKNDTAEREQKRVAVVYFSGTGCTAEAAKCITKSFSDRGAQTVLLRIPFDAPVPQVEIRHADLLMVLSPVYAFRLTDIMEKWLKKLPQTTRTKAAVISVSGGGEISPNTACRITAKRILRAKGFRVTYEAMLVMPSNFAAATPAGIAARLLAVLPRKADAVVSDIFAGQKRLTRPQLPDRVLAAAGRLEHTGARFFGRFIHAGTSCTQCGRCIRNCPMKNIRLHKGKVRFGWNCMFCLRCIYECPEQALTPLFLKSAVLRGGFCLDTYRAPGSSSGDPLPEGIFWKGVADYLKSKP